MDTSPLKRKFDRVGARLEVGELGRRHWRLPDAPLTLDIGRDGRGEFFDLKFDAQRVRAVDAIDVQADMRHLLLLAWTKSLAGTTRFGPPPIQKPRFLCGHDERHWFVAAIPEAAHAASVRAAMEALKPSEVRAAQERAGLKQDDRFTRRNKAFIRQGEWFFLPRPGFEVPERGRRRNELMQRSGGKPHIAELAYRFGGERVYVSHRFPSGLTEQKYREWVATHPEGGGNFRIMMRNATLFVRGRITHPDHATIVLNPWHEVVMNTENQAAARRNVVFLD